MKSAELLDLLQADVLQALDTVNLEFCSLPVDVLNWKERPDRWSILECLEHLNRYSAYYNDALSKRIDEGRKIGRTGNRKDVHQSTRLGRWVLEMTDPENKKKKKTFRRMDPATSRLEGKEVLNGFRAHQNELLNLIRQAAPVDLNQNAVAIEFFRLLKLNLGDTLQFVVVHMKRHIIQARNVKAMLALETGPALAV